MAFKLHSSFKPAGDQPQAIEKLSKGISTGTPHQVLLGVTGSGKTFTLANVIQNIQKPTLVISHNKTLAAQLYQEFRDFFPNNAVSYFVSYYDYYQPEAYIPQTDTYIEKEVDINEDIDRLRLQATTHLFTRPDVIVVASVSCIYNLGSPQEWRKNMLTLETGKNYDRHELLLQLNRLQYNRSDYELKRGTFRVKGDTLQLWPAYEESAVNLHFLDEVLQSITPINPVTGEKVTQTLMNQSIHSLVIYPAKHYLTDRSQIQQAFTSIRTELASQLKHLKAHGKDLEAHRLNQKVNFDLEMITETGYVNGIENYSRHFDGRNPGEPPFTLFDYFRQNTSDFLVIVDESHMTIPQLNGMYHGDKARKETLIDFGFRLPSALDNRPLKFPEFLSRAPQAIYVSATPGEWELEKARGTSPVARSKKGAATRHAPRAGTAVVEQLVRPTGLLDPQVTIHPSQGQIDHLIAEIEKRVAKGERVLVTTLTKRMAEALSEHLKEKKMKVHYLHSDIQTLDRSDILDDLRKGEYDVVVGINLLREGLDLPEVSLVAILDADKEGFLRSKTSLIQTMGRAARHEHGQVLMYADQITRSMREAIKEVNRRRGKQLAYNRLHHITPRTIAKPIRTKLLVREPKTQIRSSVVQLSRKEAVDIATLDPNALTPGDKKRLIRGLRHRMLQAATVLDFEFAATLRDTIAKLSDL